MRIVDHSPKTTLHVQWKQPSPTLVIPKTEKFDESAENYIRFVQGANAFIAFFQMYESARITYLHFSRERECEQNLSMFLCSVFLNFFWILVAFIGISSINSRKSWRVQRYRVLLFLVGLTRMIYYFTTSNMVNEATSIGSCNLNQSDIYVASSILEGTAITVLLFLLQTIQNYIQACEDDMED